MAKSTLNIAINPMGAKQLQPEEAFVPAHLELRNGLRTDGGFYRLRPGYEGRWTLGTEQAITLLFPHKRNADSRGFAVTEDGKIYELRKNLSSIFYAGPTLNGTFRPTWCQFDQTVIVCDGQAPIRLAASGTTTSLLGGNPPAAKFCAVIADRVVLSGYDDTGFRWSDPGSAEIWPVQNVSNVTGHGEGIRYMQVKDQDLYFFKDAAVEIWAHVGDTTVFARKGIVTFLDKFTTNRYLAGFSVVQAGNPSLFYFYANGDFYRLNGFQPESISGLYKREIGKLETTSQMYGFHFSYEHVIRWFEPVSGRCFVYDYVNDVFTEDNAWLHGDFARLPIYSHMEMDGETYVGDYDPTGRVYRWTDQVHSDAGREIRLLRKVRVPLNEEGHKCRVSRLQVRAKRGHSAGARGNLWPSAGTFETGVEGFTTYVNGVVTTTPGHASSLALSITSSGTLQGLSPHGPNYGGAVTAFPLLSLGRRYTLRFYAKALNGAPTIRVSVQNGASDENALSHAFHPSSEWQEFTHSAAVDLNKSFLYFWSEQASMHWAIDDLRLEDAAEDRAPLFLARWAFDEGQYTPYTPVDLGVSGDRDPYIDLWNLGVGRELTLELVQTDSVMHLMTHANLTVRPLGR